MQGYDVLWMPGTDHAGIATQAVVERRLRDEEKKTRHDLGREELVQRIWQWKDQYEKRILGQLGELGCSCDWQRTRFTLDPVCAAPCAPPSFNMFKDGLIFRGKRLVNWDAQLQTSVADDEVENVKQKGKFYYFRYPVLSAASGSLDHVLIGTTRPETMLGDTAVAVHPEPARELDRRERDLETALAKAGDKDARDIQERLDRLRRRREEMLPHLEKLAEMARAGTILELPLLGRKLPLIADRYADPEKGTGAVKITPAHDYNDYAVWERHKDTGPPINILHPDGSINDNGRGEFRGRAFSYAGLDRTEARRRVVDGPAGTRPVRPRGGHREHHPAQRPQQDADRAVPVGSMVRAHGRRRRTGGPGPARHRCREGRPGPVHPRALCQDLSRLARREARLVHQPAAVVGPSHSHLVRQLPRERVETPLRRPRRRDVAAR